MLQGCFDGGKENGIVEGLANPFQIRRATKAAHAQFVGAADKNERNPYAPPGEGFRDLKAVHSQHVQIHHNTINVVDRLVMKRIDQVLARSVLHRLHACSTNESLHREADGLVVIDDGDEGYLHARGRRPHSVETHGALMYSILLVALTTLERTSRL